MVTAADLALLDAAASLCDFAPARMRCAHMAAPLTDLRRRLVPLVPVVAPEAQEVANG